jgi:Cys-tRNA(Pro)/Cys-tRNA(Cys) deacylase
MPELPPGSLALGELGIPHRVFTHVGPVASLEQAARERGHRSEQVIRSLLFRLKENEYVMVLMSGPAQVSWKALRKYLARPRISMATEEEVLDVTGYPIGAVGPFGLARPLRILIDPSVLNEAEVSIGSGLRGTAIILRSEDLLNGLPDAEVTALSETT